MRFCVAPGPIVAAASTSAGSSAEKTISPAAAPGEALGHQSIPVVQHTLGYLLGRDIIGEDDGIACGQDGSTEVEVRSSRQREDRNGSDNNSGPAVARGVARIGGFHSAAGDARGGASRRGNSRGGKRSAGIENALFYEPKEDQRMGVKRVQMAAEAGANVMVTACPFCMVNMEDAIKVAGMEGKMTAIDLTELVERQMR